jgi:hypothetical protein
MSKVRIYFIDRYRIKIYVFTKIHLLETGKLCSYCGENLSFGQDNRYSTRCRSSRESLSIPPPSPLKIALDSNSAHMPLMLLCIRCMGAGRCKERREADSCLELLQIK